MDSIDDDFSHYLEMYKNNYVAYGLDSNSDNKNLLNKAKDGLKMTHGEIEEKHQNLMKVNKKLRKKMNSLNNLIKRSENKNKKLEGTTQRLTNSDAGAIEQNTNTITIYRERRLKLILEVVLISLILILGYINGDIIQAIGSKFSAKTK
jgi:chromosome segregation ATPase